MPLAYGEQLLWEKMETLGWTDAVQRQGHHLEQVTYPPELGMVGLWRFAHT
jgi:hypothetical protein